MNDFDVLKTVELLAIAGNNTYESLSVQFSSNTIDSLISKGYLINTGKRILITSTGQQLLTPVESTIGNFEPGTQLLFD